MLVKLEGILKFPMQLFADIVFFTKSFVEPYPVFVDKYTLFNDYYLEVHASAVCLKCNYLTSNCCKQPK